MFDGHDLMQEHDAKGNTSGDGGPSKCNISAVVSTQNETTIEQLDDEGDLEPSSAGTSTSQRMGRHQLQGDPKQCKQGSIRTGP